MPNSTPKKKVSQLVAAEYVWEVLIAVALPPTAFALIGRWLDQRYHQPNHLFTLLGFFLSLFVVVRLMMEKAKRFKEIYHDSTTPESAEDASTPSS